MHSGTVLALIICASCTTTIPLPKTPISPGEPGPAGGVIWYANRGIAMESIRLEGEYTFDQAPLAARTCSRGGFADWRLPTRGELQLLAGKLHQTDPATAGRVWSGSHDGAATSRFAWFVDLPSGLAYHNSAGGKLARYPVYAVRQFRQAKAGASDSEECGRGGGILVPEAGDLELSPLLGHATWDEARRLAAAYRGSSCTDWHLPDLAELRTIHEKLGRNGRGALAADRYWTSSPSPSGEAWFIDFADGKAYASGHGGTMSIRPFRAVRGKP